MAKSPAEMQAAMVKNLATNTGKTLAAWVKIVKKSGLEKHGQMVALLKSEHGVTHGYASLIAHSALGNDFSPGSSGDLVAAQYAGPKAALRPIYDKLAQAIAKFGKDVEVSPKKAYVSMRRSKQFAIIQPSTKTRVDVGLNLKGAKPTARLEASGSFNSMCSHRVRVEAAKDIDKQLLGWLKEAYERA